MLSPVARELDTEPVCGAPQGPTSRMWHRCTGTIAHLQGRHAAIYGDIHDAFQAVVAYTVDFDPRDLGDDQVQVVRACKRTHHRGKHR